MWVKLIFIISAFIPFNIKGNISGIKGSSYTFQYDSLLYLFYCSMGMDTFPVYIIDLKHKEIVDSFKILRGNGPDELRSPVGFKGFFGIEDTLYIYDSFKNTIMIYNVKNKTFLNEVPLDKVPGYLVYKFKKDFIFSKPEGILIGNKEVDFLKIKEKDETRRQVLLEIHGKVFVKGDTLIWIHPIYFKIFGYNLEKDQPVFKINAPRKLKGDVYIHRRGQAIAGYPDPAVTSFVWGNDALFIFRNSVFDKKKRRLVKYDFKKRKFSVFKTSDFYNLMGFYNGTLFFSTGKDTLYYGVVSIK